MTIKNYSSKGIVLAKRNFSEADRIIVLYTENLGKLSLIAKGVRKLKSRKRGSLEVFNLISFSAAKTKGLDIITESQLEDAFSNVKKDLKKASLAYYFIEVIGRITKEGERNKRLFDHLLLSIRNLGKTKSLKDYKEDFIYKTLVILGYWPEGRKLINADSFLESVLEREVNSARVGKRVLRN